LAGDSVFATRVLARIRKDFTIGAESRGEVLFTGQRIRWQGTALTVDQDKAIDELEEVPIARGLPDSQPCTPQQHTAFRNISGSLNWFQSRTQFQIGYKFSRAASAAAAPQIKDLRAVNKIVRAVKAAPQRLFFWPNNEDNSSQRGQVILLAQPRVSLSRDRSCGQARDRSCGHHGRGSLVDYESTKIRRTTLSITVAELYSFMKCYGTWQLLRGLWMDTSGEAAPIHMRTDANNLVTTAATTHLPAQKETIHMIQNA
jgi:hypothetical protein